MKQRHSGTLLSEKTTIRYDARGRPKGQRIITRNPGLITHLVDPSGQPLCQGRPSKTMYCLTLRRPWAEAVSWLSKTIENRTVLWKCLLDQPLAIHCGRGVDITPGSDHVRLALKRAGHYKGSNISRVLCVVRVVAIVDCRDPKNRVRYGLDWPVNPIWWVGPVGYVFDEIQRLDDPVPCSGQQGLWHLHESTLKRVKAQIDRAPEQEGI